MAAKTTRVAKKMILAVLKENENNKLNNVEFIEYKHKEAIYEAARRKLKVLCDKLNVDDPDNEENIRDELSKIVIDYQKTGDEKDEKQLDEEITFIKENGSDISSTIWKNAATILLGERRIYRDKNKLYHYAIEESKRYFEHLDTNLFPVLRSAAYLKINKQAYKYVYFHIVEKGNYAKEIAALLNQLCAQNNYPIYCTSLNEILVILSSSPKIKDITTAKESVSEESVTEESTADTIILRMLEKLDFIVE